MDIVQEFPEEVHTLQKCTRETSRQAETELQRLVAQTGQAGVNR
jgi:hypothetical protein